MKKRLGILLGIVSAALVTSVVSLNTSKNNEVDANDPSLIGKIKNFEGDGYALPASTYLDSPTNEPKYNGMTTFTDIGSYSQKTATYDRINVEQVWSSYRGDAVKVALIDTGCNMNHEEFSGTNFNSNSRDIYNSSSTITDTSGHGTDTAATLAASINNKGGSGIAPNVDLYIIRAVDASNGFPIATLRSALTYCVNQGVDIINMSIQGMPQAISYSYVDDMKGQTISDSVAASMYESSLQSYIDTCYENDITIVAAAGNYNTDIKTYPAANDHVIAVGATGLNSATAKAGFSNYGDWVDVVAPGYVIVPSTSSNTSYCLNGGTSFAAPVVTGAIALYKQKYPTAKPDQIEKALKLTCTDVNFSGAGAGQIDVDAFLNIAPDHIYVDSVTLDDETKTLTVGDTYQLNAIVLPVDADQNVTYESYDEDVCTVDENGLVTAIGEGESIIYVYSDDDPNKCASVYITVESNAPKTKTMTLSSGEYTASTSESDAFNVWEEANILSILQEKDGGTTVAEYISEPRWYQGNLITFTPLSGSIITKIEITCTSNSYASVLNSSTWSTGSKSVSGSTFTWTGSESSPFTCKVSAKTIISSIKITYTKGSLIEYTVSFNANTGTGSMDNSVTAGSTYTAPICNFTKTDYTFDGWALNSTTGDKYDVGDIITGITGDITLYATWKEGAGPTPGPDNEYYDSITATEGNALLAQLHTLMGSTHKKYTTYNDCKDPNKVYSTDPGSTSAYITDFYTQKDIAKSWGSGAVGTWNREHVWCQSLTNSLWGESYGGSDLQHVRPDECTLNSTRNNHPYGIVSDHDNKKVYSKNTSKQQLYHGGWCDGSKDIFEPLDSVKGDVARILMYDYMHYSNATGGTDGTVSGHTGNLQINKIVKTSANTAQAAWDLLLDWNEADPVSESERTRNEAAYAIQGNRNPFIDNDKYAAAIWGNTPLTTKTLTSISLSGSVQTEFNVGETFTYSGLVVTAHYSDSTQSTVTPTSVSTPDMTTAEQGKPVTVSYTEGGVTKNATYTIDVKAVAATSIGLNTNSTSVKIGNTVTLTATVNPSNATDKSVTWTSSDNNIATVTNGVVTGVSAGTATITAKTSNNLTATCDVTVQAPTVDEVTLDLSEKKVRYTASTPSSNTFTLTATLTAEEGATVTWTSSNTDVIRVVTSGEASAAASSSTEVTGNFEIVGTGTSTITASAGGKSATCEVKATLPVKSYVAEPTSTNVAFTGSTSSVPSKLYEVYTDNTRECIDENYMLSVDSSKLGNATASSTYDGKSITANVVVTNQGSSGETIKTQEDYNKQAEAWAIYFIAQTRTEDTCLASSDEDKLAGLKVVWSSLGSEYGNMLPNSKTAFCSSSASAKIKEALQHYQYIISKFTELTDFVVDGSGNKPASSSRSLLSTMFSKENTGLTVVILSVVGLVAIGSFFVFRKRKTY